jgi:preprotein translocase subunit SecF
MNLMNHKYTLLLVPGIVSLLALVSIALWGLKPGVDIASGTNLQIAFPDGRPAVSEVQRVVSPLGLGEVRVQPTGANSYILRERTLTNDEKNTLENALATLGTTKEENISIASPAVSSELFKKGMLAFVLVALSVIIFIAFAFRHVSKPLASWKYGVIVIVTLLHDVIVPVGLFALLGHVRGAEVDSLFIVALLTILGVSINDTIVVFDRIRENLKHNQEFHKKEGFDEVVSRSIWQTLTRSINTSLAVLIVLFALFLIGPVSTKDFALTLIAGMIAGTYSSMLLAAPLLVIWEEKQKKPAK